MPWMKRIASWQSVTELWGRLCRNATGFYVTNTYAGNAGFAKILSTKERTTFDIGKTPI